MPLALAYLNRMLGAGVQLTLQDYRGLASINRDDLADWRQAEAQRMEDEIALAAQERERR